MTEQPNPYSQPEETKGVLVGEAKTPRAQGRLLGYQLGVRRRLGSTQLLLQEMFR